MYGLECRTSRNSTVALTHLQEKLANNLVKKIHTRMTLEKTINSLMQQQSHKKLTKRVIKITLQQTTPRLSLISNTTYIIM